MHTSQGPRNSNVCVFDAPSPATDFNTACWPVIEYPDDWWCGVGCDIVSGTPFNAFLQTPVPGATNGTFSLSNESTKTITDTNSAVGSTIKVWWLTATPGSGLQAIIATPAAGTFDVAVDGGVAVTGDFGYTIYN